MFLELSVKQYAKFKKQPEHFQANPCLCFNYQSQGVVIYYVYV